MNQLQIVSSFFFSLQNLLYKLILSVVDNNIENNDNIQQRGEAILVFLPGISAIEKLQKILRSRQILDSLHAMVIIEISSFFLFFLSFH